MSLKSSSRGGIALRRSQTVDCGKDVLVSAGGFQPGLIVQFSGQFNLSRCLSCPFCFLSTGLGGKHFSSLPLVPLHCVALLLSVLFPGLFSLKLSHFPDRRPPAERSN